MKPRLISLTLAAAVALSAQSIPASYKDLKFGPLNPVKVPKIERFTLPNGIRVLLVEDHELPFFNARAFIPGGENQDPADKVGLAAITLGAMRTGGSTSKSGDDLDKELDRLPATVETSSDDDANAAVVSSLKENSARVLEILSGLLRNPAFLQEKIDLEKTQIRAGIERRNEDTMGIAYRETARLLFGKDSPKARQVEYAHLDAIQREDVLAYHKANIQPDHMMLGVWGDFDSASMRALITKTFGSWPRGGRPKPPALKVDLAAQSKGVYLANKDDVTQSWIQVSHLVDMLPSHPDYPAMTVAMNVLGGGFGSRMFNNIRTTEGLAYAASAGFSTSYDAPGVFRAMVGTENKNVPRAIESMKRQIRSMREAEITTAELERAKDSYLKGDAFNYDSTGKILTRQLVYEYYGYPANFLETLTPRIGQVTRAQVLAVSKKYIDESRFAILVAGKNGEYKDQLAGATTLDISIPQPKMAGMPAAGAQDAGKARALMAKARQAHGGPALSGVTNYFSRMERVIVTPHGEFTTKGEGLVDLAGRSRVVADSPAGQIVQVFDGKAVWLKSPQGVQQFPPQFLAEARASGLRENLALLQNWDKPGYQVQPMGLSKLEGKDVEGVLISNEAANFQVKLFLDPQTGLMVGRGFVTQGNEVVESLSDVRDVGGVKVPFRSIRTAGGKKTQEIRIQELKINPGAPDSAFAKPE